MKERPILMSGPMIRAVLNGAKTQTRRVLKPQRPDWWPDYCAKAAAGYSLNEMNLFYPNGKPAPLPYGSPGDSLWVRETHNIFAHGDPSQPGGVRARQVVYRADNEDWEVEWRPSIFMPRWASRLTLEVTGVRVERLQDISEADAIAEGVQPFNSPSIGILYKPAFCNLWNEINGKRPGCSWQDNPWVWVVSFKRKD